MVGVSNDDVGSSAGNYSLDLRLLGLEHSELVKCLLQKAWLPKSLVEFEEPWLSDPRALPIWLTVTTRRPVCRRG
jgi:hypothetical protein